MMFWQDLGNDLADPEFAAHYAEATHLITTLDGIANASLRGHGDESR